MKKWEPRVNFEKVKAAMSQKIGEIKRDYAEAQKQNREYVYM